MVLLLRQFIGKTKNLNFKTFLLLSNYKYIWSEIVQE